MRAKVLTAILSVIAGSFMSGESGTHTATTDHVAGEPRLADHLH